MHRCQCQERRHCEMHGQMLLSAVIYCRKALRRIWSHAAPSVAVSGNKSDDGVRRLRPSPRVGQRVPS
ncbi:hypothetical protein WAI453_010365 [Rhynchosporium graminicola]